MGIATFLIGPRSRTTLLVLLMCIDLYHLRPKLSLSPLLPVDDAARIEWTDICIPSRRGALCGSLCLEIETARRQAFRAERQNLPSVHVAVRALRERHKVGSTRHGVLAELGRAVGRQGADNKAAVVVGSTAVGRVAIGDLVLFVRGSVDDRLSALLVPRPEALAAPCLAVVVGGHGVREAGPVDGYPAGLEAVGVVCVDPGAQRAVAIAGQNGSAGRFRGCARVG